MKKYTIQISEEGLKGIQAALDCYSRLGINQFSYCLEHNPAFVKLEWEDQQQIEEYLKFKIDSRGFGIYHPDVKKFTRAFEIMQEIEKYMAISENPIRESHSKDYDGALNPTEDIPVFLDENGKRIEDKIEIDIPKNHQRAIKILADKKDFEALWNYIDNIGLKKDINGPKSRISDDFSKLIIYSPYRKK